MLPIKTWNDLEKTMKERSTLHELSAIMILILNPNNSSQVQRQIFRNIEYLNSRSGMNVDFYLPGFEIPRSYNLSRVTQYFDTSLFICFIKTFEAMSLWRYTGGSQLVVLKYQGEAFSFSGIYDINLDKLCIYCPQQMIDVFFEELIRLFDKPSINMANLFVDSANKFVLRSQGWDLIAGFLSQDIKSIFSGISESAQIYKLFKKKDLRLRYANTSTSLRQKR